MTREDYAIRHIKELKRLKARREKLKVAQPQNVSQKRWQAICADLNRVGMEIIKTKERISFAMGHLRPEECTREFNLSGMHRYEGIRGELENTNFNNEF